MFTVHVRVTDAASGKATPVRLRLTDHTGRTRAPLGRLTDFSTRPGTDVGGQVLLEGRAYAYIDGSCEVPLPAGTITAEISKGPEYAPLTREVSLAEGQIALRFTIDRWANWQEQGWYAGDTRATDLPPHAALLEGAAEGLAVVQLLAYQRPAAGAPAALPNLLAFSGSHEALRSAECLVAVNTRNDHPALGTLSLLHCHRPVFPLRAGDGDDWSVADWCDQCHRKTGLVVWPDLPRLAADRPQGEALAALLLGKVDAFEIAPFSDPEPETLRHYYALLDAGCRPVLVGGSGKDSNAVALGAVRTYARLGSGQALEAGTWIEAVRAGRTFVTSGPLLTLEAGGLGPGSVVRLPPGQPLRLRAEAHSHIPFDELELLAGGSLLATKTASGNRQAAVLETDYVPPHSTWIAARCHAPTRLATGSCVFAHTSPVWVEVAGRPMPVSDEGTRSLDALLEQTAVRAPIDCPAERPRQQLLETIRAARQVLRSRRHASAP